MREEADLAKIGLVWVGFYSRSMFYPGTHVGVAFDTKPGPKFQCCNRGLGEVMGATAMYGGNGWGHNPVVAEPRSTSDNVRRRPIRLDKQ